VRRRRMRRTMGRRRRWRRRRTRRRTRSSRRSRSSSRRRRRRRRRGKRSQHDTFFILGLFDKLSKIVFPLFFSMQYVVRFGCLAIIICNTLYGMRCRRSGFMDRACRSRTK